MTTTDIKARIEELEKRRFYLSMKDHWDYKDFSQDGKLAREIAKLTAELQTA